MKKLLIMLFCMTCSLLHAQETIYCYIQNGNDDAYQLYRNESWGGGPSTGEMILDSDVLQMGYIYGEHTFYDIGLRYQSVPIPKGSVIVSAHIQFNSYEANYDTIPMQIFGELNPAPLPFTNVEYNITDRESTSSYNLWSALDWIGFNNGPNMRTNNLKNIVQEIIDLDGWEEGNPLVLKVHGYNWGGHFASPKKACSWEWDIEWYAPQLEITYHPPASVDEYSLIKSVHIYPNPVENDFIVLFVDLKQGEYEGQLIDMQGNIVSQVFHGSHMAGDLELELSADKMGLPPGLYLLRLAGEGDMINQKIIVR